MMLEWRWMVYGFMNVAFEICINNRVHSMHLYTHYSGIMICTMMRE
jgi:hypothetical protein